MNRLPWLVASDLDGTLLGDASAVERFRSWWRSLHPAPRLVYASGRYYASIVASVQEWKLPSPDAVVANVGSEVRLYPCGRPLEEWSHRWRTRWQLDEVRSLLDRELGLNLQPPQCQSDFKRSYTVYDADEGWLAQVRDRLREKRIAAELVYSSGRDLDVLPMGVSKGTAIEFLAQSWQIPKTHVLVAGDSGNDLSMFQQGYRGVVVANAQMELADASGPHIYHARRQFADGVIEGFEYWIKHQTSVSRVSQAKC